MSVEGFFELGGELEGEGVQTLREIANVLQEIVVGDEGGDGSEKAGGGGHERFGDAGSDSAKAGGAGSAKAGEGVNDAPNRTEETDKGSDASGGGEPGHAFLDATDFVGGGKLHADGDGLQGFEFRRGGIAGAGELGLEFAITGGVDVGERRAGGDNALRIGNALGGTKDFEELVALALDASEETHFLEDQGPGNQGEEQQDAQHGARDPSGLRKNVEDVANDDDRKQKDNVDPSEAEKFCYKFTVAHAWGGVKRNEMRCVGEELAALARERKGDQQSVRKKCRVTSKKELTQRAQREERRGRGEIRARRSG